MDWKLEIMVVPGTDVDRARRFYSEQVGFAVDHDTRVSDDLHVVQLTRPGRPARSPSAGGSSRWPPARSRACSWWSPTSRPPGPS
jgi:hypothetical protein